MSELSGSIITICSSAFGWSTLQIGENRLIIGLVKRVHVREELIDRETLRIRAERFHVIGNRRRWKFMDLLPSSQAICYQHFRGLA
jgi:hypothetical protein